ncbi:MAG: hypothetical protein DRR16_17350, partial [Candidatus Parabeggiatoa sp. nov. 3]
MTHAQNHLYPLTSPQREIWFDQMLHPSLPLYNVGGYMQIDGAVDPKLFEQAVNLLVQRHDALRTVLVPTSDIPMQTFLEDCPVTVPFHDFSGENDPRQAALVFMEQQVVQPFDLYEKPLCHFALLKIDENCFFCFGKYHHLIVDGWSIALITQSLAEIYTQLIRGQFCDRVAPSYLAFVQNDRAYIESSLYEVHRQYWLEKYQTLPEPLFTPRYLSQFVEQIAPSECQVLWLPRPFYNRLLALAKNTQSTLFHVMLGALYVYFTRTTQREELAIGLPVLNRSNASFKETMGLFIGVSAAWFQFGTQLSFRQLLKAIGKVLKSDYRRQRLPISELNRALGIHKMGRRQLFDLQLNYAKQEHVTEFEAFKTKSTTLTNDHEQTPLSISVWEFHENENVQVDFVYNLAYFDAAEIERIQSRFMLILEYVLTHVDESIRTIPLLTKSEQQQLVAWNDTAVDYPHDKTIIDLFEEQVDKTPDAIAVVFEDQQLTYRELNKKANQLAHYLLNLKTGTDNCSLITDNCLVGICIERSFEMVIGLLGILKAGGAYVPLDPAYPAARLAFMLDDAQVPVLLTQSSLTEKLPETQALEVCLDAETETLSQKSSENIVNGVGPENLAYVIYTSGSTGNPKGVLIAHQGLCNLAQAQIKLFQVQSDSRILQFASLGFDVAISDITMALCSGATLGLVTQNSIMSPEELIRILGKLSITHLEIPASVLGTFPLEKLPSLQTLIVGGETCSPTLVEQWSKGRRFFNAYGPTEGTVCATVFENTAGSTSTLPIGHPIANTQTYILDQNAQPLPVGVPGELHISGAGLARGYLNRPDLTAEKFIKNPFSDAPNWLRRSKDSRLYKTGDLARYLPDGNIEYLGRIDNQVKMRGFRIELGEIEAILVQHPAVQENAVIVHELESGDKRLVACLVPNQGQTIDNTELRSFLKDRLPDYMIPKAFVTLEALPLTPNGKIDRRALSQLSVSHEISEEQFVAPRTPEEELLAGIFAEVLGIERVGLFDNFFELGGHSLLATQVISRIRDTFSCELPLRELFESATVSNLANQIEANRFDKPSAPPIQMIDRTGNMPLSFAQQRLWFLNQLSGESAAYNIPAALHIEGPLQQNALVQSLAALVERHESLRTVFPTKNGTPVVQLSEGSFKLSVISLLDLPQSEIEVEVQKLINEDAQRPFDLEKGPLFRTTLLHTVRNESYVLLVNMHHIISDGWSLSVLIREFSTFYEAFLQNQPSPLPPLPIQYVDFAHWQRQWLSGEVLEKQVNYWKQQLAGIPALLELPTDHPRPPIQGFQGASLPISLSLELTTQLKQISQKTGTTLFMTLWSAFATLLSRYTGQSDIVIGSPIANRTMSVTESLIGFFVNTLVLRLDLTDNPPFEDILLKARRVALEAYSHQDIPFEQLVEALQPERNLSHSPLFQVMFVLQNAPIADLELAGLSLTLLEPENLIAKFDLTLELTETVSGLSGRLEYNTDLFERATIERLSGHLQTLLTGIVENPKTPIHELRLLTKAEHQQLLAWNDTATDYPHDKTIIDLFEEQVDKTPDAIAVVFEEQQLTYRKLNQKANQLAHYLISLKSDDNGSLITDNCLVGICIERSLEMVIGLLGILKVGGAYLPLDPAYPTARLAFMLEDAQVPVLLTQSSLKEKLPETQAQVVCLDAEAETLSQLSSENVVSGVGPENLAYVIYTSGSTGQPKGVAIEHRNVVALLEWSKTIFTLEQISGTLLSTSLNFDVSVFELFVPLCRGGKIILVENILSLSTLSEKAGVVMVNTVPSAMKELIKINGIPASVRVLNLAGEPFSPQLVQELYQIKTIQQIINIYGPTEDTVYATFTLLSQSPHEKLTIGRPISNAQTYILAHNLQSVPIGVLGELHLGGAGVARGYLNCPELTAEKFIKNPFSDDPNSRLYKTGDLARYLPDGNIEYLGRIDNQVKMRGFRIELGEIEAVLGQHPNVQQSVVITREDQPGNQRLVAYIVSDFIPERIPYQTECLAKWDGNTLKLRTEDISKRGVLLGGAVTFDENQELSLHLRLPGEFEARWLKGKVAWLQQTSWAGIEFTLTPNEQTLLNQSIKYLLETQGILKILQRLLTGNLRDYLKEKLPHYMVPSHFELLNALPLTPNGKIDRSKLSAPLDSPKPERAAMPQTEVEQLIATVWQEVLHVDKVGIYDNFFDLGGHSLLIIQVQAKLQKAFAKEISVVELFEHPTIHALAQHLGQTQCTPEFIPEPQPSRFRPRPSSNDIAIIGMSGRFPGATDIEAFWQNLQHGVESITFFADEELQASGIDTTTLNKPNYVKASAVLSDIDAFDALFFDINPKEAEMTDPQQRLFLECAWEAIENAGYEAGPDEQAIGVYAGVGMNTYLLNNLSKNSELKDTVDAYQVLISNGNDFLPTRVSYKLNLTGPSVNVQTACSTSLVAVSLACDSLLNGHCDMALAGGVSIRVPHKSGYLYQEGMILSPDGHCRAFDAKAQGTVGGNGVGIVVLKRLEEAIADGDSIQAIIKGSATNNDGALKVGYTAPSVKGQALVISEAQALAGIEPETISYIETHGTGTELGDPIEIAALTKAFQTEKTGFCAIGSLKSNIGHTDAAAGVAGLIKTVLALKHQVLPPSLHFEQPNPQIDFANSPFYVNTTLSEWKTNGTPRRAGVSSFGIGGTNAHVILEEAPTPEPSGQSRPWQLLVLSAKTASALESATANLAKYLAQHPDINLADVAYTLSKGRQAFNQRRMLICQNLDEATTALRTLEPTSVLTHSQALKERPVVFMFSGQGAQYV